jgi:divalent metal cation (Fe/Co/Zn/Cd) transporter
MMLNQNKRQHLIKKALTLEWILISYNILEGVFSILFGVFAGSVVLVGFGLDSFIEVSAAGIIVWRLSHRGTEEEETEKEKKALFFIGITFFLLAAYILYEAGGKLIRQEQTDSSTVGIVIATLSLIIMPILGLAKRKIARQIGSRALESDSTETLICAYLSFTLLLGLSLNALFGWWWADPVAALAMVYFIVKEGREAVRGARCC